MLEQIENKIEELKQLRSEEYYKKKDEDLKAWGLTTKTDGKKVTPIIVTDDEYEELVKASNGVGKVGRNSVSIMLNILSYIVIVIGIVTGGVLSQFTDSLALVSFSIAVVLSAIIAVIFRGIAEAIRLLQQIIDSKPIQRPEPLKVKKPDIKRTSNKYRPEPAPAPYYAPYPPQQAQPPYGAYPYPYNNHPMYEQPPQPYQQPYQQPEQFVAAPEQATVPADTSAVDSSAYTPEAIQAYYQNNR